MTYIDTHAGRPARKLGQDGFTMVELLIVVLLLGVLTAIAIPTYLGQKHRGFDTQMKSILRTAATYEDTFVVDNRRYGTLAELVSDGAKIVPADGATVRLLRYEVPGFCLEASHASSDKKWYWDSKAGGLQPQGASSCPEATTGTVGDALP